MTDLQPGDRAVIDRRQIVTVEKVTPKGRERKAVGGGKWGWRFWTPRDRAQPMIDHADRERKRREYEAMKEGG